MHYPNVSLTALSIAVLGAFSAHAAAADYGSIDSTDPDAPLQISKDIINITADKYWAFSTGSSETDKQYVSIYQTGKTISITGSEINISVDKADYSNKGIYQTNADSVLQIGQADSAVAIRTTSKKDTIAIQSAEKASTTIDGTTILIDTSSTDGGYARAVQAANGATVTLGSADTKLIEINASGNSTTMGLFAVRNSGDVTNGGSIIVNAEEFRVTSSGTFSVHAQNASETEKAPDNASSIIINAGKTTIKNTAEDGIGLSAFSNGYLEVNGDLTVEASKAINVRGNSTVLINKDKTGVVTLNGDIVFDTPNQKPDGDSYNSGAVLNANVTVNLTEGSSWTGRAYQGYPVKNTAGKWEENKTVELEDNRDKYYGFVKNFSVNIDNGGVWNMTGDSFVNNAAVNEGGVVNVKKDVKTVNAAALDMNGGVINMQGSAEQQVNVVSLTGTGGTVKAATSVNADGSLATARMTVGAVEGAPAMTVNYTGITADNLTAENVKNLKAISVAEGSALATTETVDEGDIYGKWTRTTDADGTSSTSVASNTKLDDFSAVNAMSLVQWRNEINHLTKRLGDIRASESAVGAWARVYGGASEWGDNSTIEMDHTTVQVGGDYRLNPNWIVGAAFSYTDSDADLVNGQAEGESYSLAAYATWMGETGSYLDMIARYGYLKNDIYAGNMVLDTSSNAFSLSFEGGHQFRFMERAYVEPQIELTYGFISGDEATADNGVRVEQDDYQNLITRIGLRTGFDFPEKAGTIYAMVSYSYDFLGDADGTATKAGLRQDLNEDLGGGWVSYGVGAQFKLGDNAFAYGELERTSGGDIDNPYLFNVGLRWNF